MYNDTTNSNDTISLITASKIKSLILKMLDNFSTCFWQFFDHSLTTLQWNKQTDQFVWYGRERCQTETWTLTTLLCIVFHSEWLFRKLSEIRKLSKRCNITSSWKMLSTVNNLLSTYYVINIMQTEYWTHFEIMIGH